MNFFEKKRGVLFDVLLTVFIFNGFYLLGSEEISYFDDISVENIISDYVINRDYLYQTDLCVIMNLYGSDKGGRHNYTTLYSKLFEAHRDKKLNVFELGLGTNYTDVPSNMGPCGVPGASLRGWAEYFPYAQIYGADIDRRILFRELRISTFYCDQLNKNSIEEMFSNPELVYLFFDIIVEDGLHEYKANITFLKNSMSHLKKGGIYIVEDLLPGTVTKIQENIIEFKKEFRFAGIINIPKKNMIDNTLLIIQK